METIHYQEQEIEVYEVHSDNTVRGDGSDTLYRDTEGRYYLERYREPADGDFYSLHRISSTTAILWSIDSINRFNVVREDAANRLMTNRTSADPAASLADDDAEDDAEATEFEELPDRQFSFTFKPTSQTVGSYLRIEVPGILMGEVVELADIFHLTPRTFLRRYILGTLPGQPRWRNKPKQPLTENLQSEHVGFVCFDEAMKRRIERAAQSREQTVAEFVAQGIGELVDCYEEGIIVHPETGALLTDGHDLYRRLESRETAPPIGREHEPRFQRPPAPILLQLDSKACKLVRRYLEVSPWSYTSLDIVSGCVSLALELAFGNQEEAERMCGLDSGDFHDGDWGSVEESIFHALKRRTGGKSPHIKGAPGEPVGEDAVGVLIPKGLDAEAIELVRRFQEVSPRKYPLADIISGCVQYAMATAFECHERGYHRPRNGRRFADSGWGYVETDIANVRLRREGKPTYTGDGPDDERAEEPGNFATGRRHAGNPADVALLAAAEPEPIEEAPPDEPEDDEDDNSGEEWKEGK